MMALLSTECRRLHEGTERRVALVADTLSSNQDFCDHVWYGEMHAR